MGLDGPRSRAYTAPMRTPPPTLLLRAWSAFLSLLLAGSPALAGGNVRAGEARGGRVNGSPAGPSGGAAGPAGAVPVVRLEPSLSPLNGVSLSPPALSPALPPSALAAPAEGSRPDAPRAAPPSPSPGAALPAPAQAEAAARELPAYALALRRAGAPQALVERLDDWLVSRHPGEQDRLYHGLQHSRDVAGVAARLAESAGLSGPKAALVVFAASLHDVDPERAAGSPPSVEATVRYLARDEQARELLAAFSRACGFTPGQVLALIKATDFHPDPERLKALEADFERAARASFPGEEAWALDWGRRLALADKTAAYLGTPESSLAFVRGLAGEFRAAASAAAGRPSGPSDELVAAGTHGFLQPLRDSPDFARLPADLRERFDATLSYFKGIGTPEAARRALLALGSAPARGPPEGDALRRDLDSARRYVAGIAGTTRLTERQRGALFEMWLEEQGIPAGSERARSVKAALLPAAAAADAAALADVPAGLRGHDASLLRLARETGSSPGAIAAELQKAGVVSDLAGLPAEVFERQAWQVMRRASLERAVRRYPDNAQGEFLRALASHIATPGGKSVEEVAREGAFAYVDFAGNRVLRARSGRDPDLRSPEVVFYITRREEKWRIDGYRQNRPAGRSDAELERRLRDWLIGGGIPAEDFAP